MWKKDEIKYLLDNVETKHLKDIASFLKKTEKATRAKAERLGIKFAELGKYSELWKEEEVEILIYNADKTLKELQQLLNRSQSSISCKSNKLGIRRQKGWHLAKRDGYIVISVDNRNVLLHRKIMSEHLGRELESQEIVHHIDLCKTNNEINNLFLTTESEHRKLHLQYNNIVKKGIVPKFNRKKRCYQEKQCTRDVEK